MKIVITGGGTGGHIYPNIALLSELEKHFEKVIYIGENNSMEEKVAKENGLKFFGITATKLVRKLTFSNFLIPFKLIKSVNEAKKILKNVNPNIIFSKGGYVSLPTVIAGKKLHIPIVIHESDLSMGLANRISLRYANLLLSSFPVHQTNKIKSKFVGSPIRDEILNARSVNLFSNNKPIVLICGGSLGASSLNSQVRKELPQLLKIYNIVHLCGKGKTKLELENPSYWQIEFTNEIGKYIASSDYVITRGGSNTLFEIIALNKPMIIAPLSKAVSRGDQIENANYFKQKGLALIHNDNELFYNELNNLQENEQMIKTNIYFSSFKDGKEDIVNELINTIKFVNFEF